MGKSPFLIASPTQKRKVRTSFCTIEPNVGVVNVPDERLTTLANWSTQKKPSLQP